jgi:cytochrome c oxidase subunit IV
LSPCISELRLQGMMRWKMLQHLSSGDIRISLMWCSSHLSARISELRTQGMMRWKMLLHL